MDNLLQYHRPAPSNFYRLLFLCTVFVIGSMCLWAFVQKRQGHQQPLVSHASPPSPTAQQASPTQLIQSGRNPENEYRGNHSPAYASLAGAQVPLAEDSAPEGESAVWQVARSGSAQLYFDEEPEFAPQEFAPPEAPSVAYQEPLLPASYEQPLPPMVDADSPSNPAVSPPVQTHPATIVTEANDSFWYIAQRVYGDPRYYRALYQHNRNWVAYPDRIEQGFTVQTPPLEELRTRYSEFCP